MPEPPDSLTSPTPAVAPARVPVCPDCRTELAPELLSCPRCHRLVHGEKLKQLTAEAQQAAGVKDLARALACWRQALQLLPPESRQAQVIAAKAAALSDQVIETPAAHSAPHGSRWAALSKRGGPLGAIAVAITFLLTKGKLLLAGLTKTGTLLSMVLSMGVYATAWGWKFAVGLVLSIYIHEMGHVAALKRFGIEATAPMFIPGVGAVIRSKHHPVSPNEDARVGLAGPLWGLGAAVAAYGVFRATGVPYWAAIARVGAWINLFNLLPVWPLDGGRGFRALSRGERWVLVAVFAACWWATRDGMVILLLIVGVVRALGPSHTKPDRMALAEFVGLTAALAALSQIVVPGH